MTARTCTFRWWTCTARTRWNSTPWTQSFWCWTRTGIRNARRRSTVSRTLWTSQTFIRIRISFLSPTPATGWRCTGSPPFRSTRKSIKSSNSCRRGWRKWRTTSARMRNVFRIITSIPDHSRTHIRRHISITIDQFNNNIVGLDSVSFYSLYLEVISYFSLLRLRSWFNVGILVYLGK